MRKQGVSFFYDHFRLFIHFIALFFNQKSENDYFSFLIRVAMTIKSYKSEMKNGNLCSLRSFQNYFSLTQITIEMIGHISVLFLTHIESVVLINSGPPRWLLVSQNKRNVVKKIIQDILYNVLILLMKCARNMQYNKTVT